MASKRPVVWNPSLLIYEQLQPSDALDVGNLNLALNQITSPTSNTTIDINTKVVDITSNGTSMLKLLPSTGAVELGKQTSFKDGLSYKRSFFNSVTTTNINPTTFFYDKLTRCLLIKGMCYVKNVTGDQDNLFAIDCAVVGDSDAVARTSSIEAIEPLVQQTSGISITFAVVNNRITFTVTGIAATTIKWNFEFTITEMDQA